MSTPTVAVFLLFVVVGFPTTTIANLLNYHPFHVDVPGEFGVIYQKEISNSIEYSWQFYYDADRIHHSIEPVVHTSVDSRADLTVPVVFEVRHHLSESWTLPVLIGENKVYWQTTKTVCTPPQSNQMQRSIEVVISTKSDKIVGFSLSLTLENIQISELNKKITVPVSPTSPTYFKVGIPPQLISSPYVRLDVSLAQSHSIQKMPACFTVSIQSPTCPVNDHQNNVAYNGISHTMSTVTTISVHRDFLEEGEKFLVFVMHQDFSLCNSSESKWKDQLLRGVNDEDTPRHLELVIRESISQSVYLTATLGVAAFLLAVCIIFAFVYLKWLEWTAVAARKDGQENGVNGDISHYQNSPFEPSMYNLCFVLFQVKDHTNRLDINLEEAISKPSDQIEKSTNRYSATFWVVSLFYGIPVIQFVLLYQRVLLKTGNEDLCYFNFKCLHSLGNLTAFNHIYSNIAYVLLGLLFLFIVFISKGRRNQRPELANKGLFTHYGIFYAMGSALVMEGLMSSFYHVCPTHLNFQFDTCFMYVTAMLCLIKIYQSRHPDSNAGAVMAFLGMGLVVFLSVITAIYQKWWLWMIITILHIVASFMFSVHLYSWGDWRLLSGDDDDDDDDVDAKKDFFVEKLKSVGNSILFPFRPIVEPLTGMLVTLNILNWACAVVGHVTFYESQDIASYLLMLFLLNMTVYMGIYVTLKVGLAKEKVPWSSWIYLGLSLPFWVARIYLFFKLTATWDKSQAESRELNTECAFLNFYDYHDIWHFLSAFGMFFMFMFLFTLDDDLMDKERVRIKVF